MNGISRPQSIGVTATERLPIFASVFLISLVFPLTFFIGTIKLSPYVVLLLLSLIPSMIYWLSGRAGPIRLADICIILIGLWGMLSWIVQRGVSRGIESGGILIVETWGAYFLARCFIRSPEAFRRITVVLFWIIVGLLPFLIYETMTGQNSILNFLSSFGSTYVRAETDPRWGLDRAQGPFQHPILLGVFCGSAVSFSYHVIAYGRHLVARTLRTLTVVFAASCSLSSGPLAGISVQLLLIGWDYVFRSYRRRWWALAGTLAAGYVTVDAISNRTPLLVMFSYFAFNPGTAYGRITILEWGWKAVLQNPVFGSYSGNWARPFWMNSASVDMFWLERTMAHGLPMGALYQMFFFLIVLAIIRRELTDPRLRAYRLGYLGGMAGLFIAGWAVSYWNEVYVLFMFLVGSGVWLLDHQESPPAPKNPPQPARRRALLG